MLEKDRKLFEQYADAFDDFLIKIDNELDDYGTDIVHWNTAYIVNETGAPLDAIGLYLKSYPAYKYAKSDKEDMDKYSMWLGEIGAFHNYINGILDSVPKVAQLSHIIPTNLDRELNTLIGCKTATGFPIDEDFIRILFPRICKVFKVIKEDYNKLIDNILNNSKFC